MQASGSRAVMDPLIWGEIPGVKKCRMTFQQGITNPNGMPICRFQVQPVRAIGPTDQERVKYSMQHFGNSQSLTLYLLGILTGRPSFDRRLSLGAIFYRKSLLKNGWEVRPQTLQDNIHILKCNDEWLIVAKSVA